LQLWFFGQVDPTSGAPGETARQPTRRRQRTGIVSARENRSRSGKTQVAVVGEIRDFVLQSLKEVLGKWVDIYTGGETSADPRMATRRL
jgi:hypothetical protein